MIVCFANVNHAHVKLSRSYQRYVLKNHFLGQDDIILCGIFFIYIYFIAIRFFPLNVYVDLQPRPSDPRLSGNSHRLPLWGKD